MTTRLPGALAELSHVAAQLLEATADYDQLIGAIVTSGARALRATCTLTLFEDNCHAMRVVAVHDDDPAVVAMLAPFVGKRRPTDAPFVQAMMRTEGLFVPDLEIAASGSQLPADSFDSLRALGISGLLGVAMRVRGESMGFITLMRRASTPGPRFDDLDRELATNLVGLAGLSIMNAELFRKVRAAEAPLFLDAIIENIPDMVFVKEAQNLTFVRFNRAGEQLLGFPREALLGKNDFDLFPRDEAEFFVAKDRETLNGGTLVDIPEEKIKTATGERWLHTKKVPIVDAHGVPKYLLGISEDITDLKRDVIALRVANEAAERANKELESFSYSVAHDLRTPLRSIDGFSQALLEDHADALGEVGRSHCMRVRSSAQRMAHLIDDLLKLSRVTRATLNRVDVDLGQLFRGSLSALQRQDPERRVDIVTLGGLVASVDARLLAIVFDNLCGNAWKFTSKQPVAHIELGTEIIENEQVYFVRDDGVGFDPAYAQKLFGVFQRLHADTEFAGTGIGLATVQRIIARHGGRIWAEATVGNGATFYFTVQPIPRVR